MVVTYLLLMLGFTHFFCQDATSIVHTMPMLGWTLLLLQLLIIMFITNLAITINLNDCRMRA